jgi:hypothetical protein
VNSVAFFLIPLIQPLDFIFPITKVLPIFPVESESSALVHTKWVCWYNTGVEALPLLIVEEEEKVLGLSIDTLVDEVLSLASLIAKALGIS